MKRIRKVLCIVAISLSSVLISPSTLFVNQPRISTVVQAKPKSVYITKTGKKYHSRKCGNGKFTKTTLVKAKKVKLKPCTKCYGR